MITPSRRCFVCVMCIWPSGTRHSFLFELLIMLFELSLLVVHGLAGGKQDPFQPENLRILFTFSLSSQTNPAFQLLLQLDYLFLSPPQISFHFLKSQMNILSQLNLDLLLGYGSSSALQLCFNRNIICWSLMFLLDSSGTSLDNQSVMKPWEVLRDQPVQYPALPPFLLTQKLCSHANFFDISSLSKRKHGGVSYINQLMFSSRGTS